MKKLIFAILATIAACSSYNKLPKEDKLKDQVTQMLTEANVAHSDLELTEYGRSHQGTKDLIVATARFTYKGERLACAVVASEDETLMGQCSTPTMTTNAQFRYDNKTGKTAYKKATQRSDTSQAAQDAGKYDLNGQDLQ